MLWNFLVFVKIIFNYDSHSSFDYVVPLILN